MMQIKKLASFCCRPVLAQLEVLTQVYFAHLLIGSQLFGRALLQYFSFEEKIGPVSNGKGLVHIMVGDEDADIFFAK